MSLEEVGAKLILEGESQFSSGMKRAEDQSSGFGRTLSKVADGIAQGFGQALFGAVSKGIGMIPDLMGKALDATMEWGQGLDDIGDILGTTVEQSAGLQTMFQSIGGSSEQLTGAMAKMSAGLLDAKGQLGPTGEALKGLGIEFRDAKGKMLPATAIFQKVADKIGNMPDGLEKTSLMMDIFGKSGKEMGDALQAASNGGMDLYIKRAKEMGLAIDPQDIIDQKIAAQTLDLAFKGIQITLGTALLPVLEKVTYGLVHMLADPAIKAGIKAISEGFSLMGELVGKVFDAIRSGNWSEAWDTVREGMLDFIPPEFEEAWIDITMLITDTIKTIKKVVDDGLKLIQGWWSENGAAILANVNIMWTGVKGLFSAAIDFVKAFVKAGLETIQSWWQTHGDTVMGIVNWLWSTVQTVFNTAISILTSVFQAFTDALEGDWEGFGQHLLDAWNTLWTAIKSAADIAWAALSEWFGQVTRQIMAFFLNTDWGRIGTTIIDGIWNGLRNGWDWLSKKVRELAATLFQAAMDALAKPGGNAWQTPFVPTPTYYPGETPELSNGGSFIIPKEYGFEGFNLGGMATASAGERVTVTPATVNAGPSNYNYSYATNYNLNLSTQQTSQSVQQSFAIMRMLAG